MKEKTVKILQGAVIAIKAGYQDLRPSEQKVAAYVLEHRREVRNISMEKLAKESSVSEPTVVRMVKALGFEGYRDFCYALLEEELREDSRQEELHPLYGYQISREDQVADIPEKITATTVEVMKDTLQSISKKSFQSIVEAIAKANRIEIFAVENSGTAASDLATKLMYLGLNCHYCSDNYLQRIGAGYLKPKDVAIGISYSGYSKDTVDAVREARRRKAKTIVITNFKNSLITKYADLLLCTSQQQLLYGDAIFSRTSQMMIVDMIYTGIISSDYETYAGRLDRSSKMICDKAYE